MTIPGHPPQRRSPASIFALLLALVALGVGGFALWTARDAAAVAADREELQQLRLEVDSLRALLADVVAPLGPTTPAPGSLTPQSTTPP